jgi:anaerobic selenocysteine-containing dehydrogenase
MSEHVTSLSGPVDLVDGRLMLQIPLEHGGDQFVAVSRRIGTVVGDELHVTIPDWLAQKLGIVDGTIVDIDNRDGKFNIRPQASGE